MMINLQVHSSANRTKNASNSRAVPVPNQRHAFAKIEERKNASKYADTNAGAGTTTSSSQTEKDRMKVGLNEPITRIPSVEDIEIPESKLFKKDKH